LNHALFRNIGGTNFVGIFSIDCYYAYTNVVGAPPNVGLDREALCGFLKGASVFGVAVIIGGKQSYFSRGILVT